MSNVFSNSSFAVLSVMKAHSNSNNTYLGSTVFVQRKPEENYGNITILSYSQDGYGTSHYLTVEDFDNQDAFEANVVPAIQSALVNMQTVDVVMSNSNISVQAYSPSGNIISN